jgi:protein PhnA
MARGYDKHQAREQAVNLLGKDLARRAKRRCELCEESESLRPWDSCPTEEPSLETLLLLCERCQSLASGAAVGDPRTLRFLEGAVWNEEALIAATAKDLLTRIDAEWARDTLELL